MHYQNTTDLPTLADAVDLDACNRCDWRHGSDPWTTYCSHCTNRREVENPDALDGIDIDDAVMWLHHEAPPPTELYPSTEDLQHCDICNAQVWEPCSKLVHNSCGRCYTLYADEESVDRCGCAFFDGVRDWEDT